MPKKRVDPLLSNYQRNQAYIRPGVTSFVTTLSPDEEKAFRGAVAAGQLPFADEWMDHPTPDYDYRGFWKAQQAGDPRALRAVEPFSGEVHFPDEWKTPYHESFSRDSLYANPETAPYWQGPRLLDQKSGKVLFDPEVKTMDEFMRGKRSKGKGSNK